MSKKLIALLMAAMMVLSVAAACGKTDAPANDNTNTTPDNSSNTTTTTPSDTTTTPTDTTEPEGKVYKTYLASEVSSLNFLDNVDSNSSTPASYAMSRMWIMYPNEEGTNYVWHDDLAVGDPIKVDAYNWQIKLREGATFQDGTPINADTWMFTFQQQLNPKTAFRMATFLYDNSVTIVNGEEYLLQGTEGYPLPWLGKMSVSRRSTITPSRSLLLMNTAIPIPLRLTSITVTWFPSIPICGLSA